MPASWEGRRALAVCAGGAIGSAVRWAVLARLDSGLFPWPVLAINVVGSVVLGILLAEERGQRRARLLLHDFGAIGVCGGLTTFSTFALEVTDLLRDGHVLAGALYSTTSLTMTIAGVVAGAAACRRLRPVAHNSENTQ